MSFELRPLRKTGPWIALILTEIAVLAHSISTLHDANEITNAGRLIFHNHVSPYVFEGHSQGLIRFMNSAVSTYVFYPLHILLPDHALALVLIMANIVGALLMLRLLAPNVQTYQILASVALALPLAPFRALIASVQHTGLILGSIAISFYLAKKNPQKSHTLLSKLGHTVLPMVFILFAIEMKPQIGLPALIAFLIINRRTAQYLFGLLILAVPLHLILDILTRRILELDWLKAISRQSAHTTLIGEEISPWKLLNTVLKMSIGWFKFSFIFYVAIILLVIFFRNKISQEILILLLISTSLVTTYVHLYDLILLSLIVTLALISKARSPLIYFSYALFVVPAHHAQTRIYIDFIFFATLIAFALLITRVPVSTRIYLASVAAGTLGFVVAESILRLHMELEAKLSITVILFELAMVCYFWTSKKKPYFGRSSIS